MPDYTIFIEKVKKKTGIDLSLYKEAQMKRRLTSLYKRKGFQSFNNFYDAIHSNEEILEEFLDRMTINVSEFYRNPQRWEVLDRLVLPDLLGHKKRLKTWSAACSTGEEPYTLAMVLASHMPLHAISIYATDLDKGAIERAEIGLYPEKAIKEVPPNILKKYFTNDVMVYRVKDEIKDRVTFKQHNLLDDPFDTGYDLIVCRNVMIYFTEKAKDTYLYEICKVIERRWHPFCRKHGTNF